MEDDKIINLFIIEDNIIYSTALKQFLQANLASFNYNVSIQEFKTSEKCLGWLECYHSTKPHIIILDYFLNSDFRYAMNGLNALFHLKIYNPDVEVIFLSGQNKIDVTVESLRTGAFDYIFKDKSAFQKVLNSVCQCLNESKFAYRINHITNRKSISF